MKYLVAGMMLVLVALSADAQIYKWLDANGKVHFGSMPPTTANAESLDLSTATTSSSPAATIPAINRDEAQKAYLESAAAERKKREAEREHQRVVEQQTRRTCGVLNGMRKDLEDKKALYRYNDQGEKVFLNDVESKAFHQQVNDEYDKNCH
tara:strand:+ start:5340 stop:5795 length:456 start_codon:yes stop_codon:yes gene_type:complete